jgi:hypothetical protein
MDIARNLNSQAISILIREERDNVVDSLCDSIGTVVGGAGIQLYDGWIHPFVAGAGSNCPDI